MDEMQSLERVAAQLAIIGRQIEHMAAVVETGLAEQKFNGPLRIIAEGVGAHYGVTVNDIRGECRGIAYARPRHVAMYLSVRLTTYKLTQIALFFHRDHTTVMYARQAVDQWRIDRDDRFLPVKALHLDLAARLKGLRGARQ